VSASSENPPLVNRAVVLLSGGLDSVAALCWAQQRYVELQAISFEYGQPNRDQEIPAAQRAAAALGVPWRVVGLSDAMRPEKPMGIMAGNLNPCEARFGGVDKAFVPGRNFVFATTALGHSCSWWPNGNVDLVMGACQEDQMGFPDCRPGALAKLAAAMREGYGRSVAIKTPWSAMTKAQILYAVQPHAEAFELVRRSFSCYSGDGPCSACSACTKRAAAFNAIGVTDLSERTHLTGGDPQRATR
jgi:7-cyano-7-deazaguanine synthase